MLKNAIKIVSMILILSLALPCLVWAQEENGEDPELYAQAEEIFDIEEDYDATGLLVTFKDNINAEKAADRIEKDDDIADVDVISEGGIAVVTIEDSKDLVDVAADLLKNKNIASVEPDRLIPVQEASSSKTKTYTDEEYHLDAINITGLWDNVSKNAVAKPKIAILDSGCYMDNPELVNTINRELSVTVTKTNTDGSYVKLTELEEPDELKHGTMVAAVIAAEASNPVKGVTGVASAYTNDKVDTYVVSVHEPGVPGFYDSDIIKGLEYAFETGANVVNMSFGAESKRSTAFELELERLYENGTVLVAAGGNTAYVGMHRVAHYPSDYPWCISVTATDENNFSAGGIYEFLIGPEKDLAAPGIYVYTIDPTDEENPYGYISGTSFSSPIVAGITGLLLAINPNLSQAEIYEILTTTATDLNNGIDLDGTTEGFDEYSGYGLVNAAKAGAAVNGYNRQDSEKQDSSIVLSDTTVTYDGQIHFPDKEITGSAGKVTYHVYKDAALTEEATPKDAGTYYVQATLAADSRYLGAESNVATLTITKAPTKIYLWQDHKIYDGTPKTYDPDKYSVEGSTGKVTVSLYKSKEGFSFYDPIDSCTEIGSYYVVVYVEGDQNHEPASNWTMLFICDYYAEITLHDKVVTWNGEIQSIDAPEIKGNIPEDRLEYHYRPSDPHSGKVEEEETIPVEPGCYYVSVKVKDSTAHTHISLNAAHLYINKIETSVTLENKTVDYTGKAATLDTPEVTGSTGEVTVRYYRDLSCSIEAEPVEPGTYYALAFVDEDEHYAATKSNVATLTILSYAPEITSLKQDEFLIRVKWKKSPGAKRYSVYARAKGGKWKKYAQTCETESTVYENDLDGKGTAYEVSVQAIMQNGQETKDFSNAKSVTLSPAASGLKVEPSSLGLLFTWKKVKGAKSYQVDYQADVDLWVQLVGNKTTTELIEKEWLTEGKTYHFYVTAFMPDGRQRRSKVCSYTYLKAPANVKAKVTDKGIQLSWNKVKGAKRYIIYDVSGNGSVSYYRQTDKTSLIIPKKGLKYNRTYSYRVVAAADGSESAPGKTVSVFRVKTPVIKSVKRTKKGISVTWKKNRNATKYRVYVKRKDGKKETVMKFTTKDTSFTVPRSKLKKGRTYSIWVRAVKDGHKSLNSVIINIKWK